MYGVVSFPLDHIGMHHHDHVYIMQTIVHPTHPIITSPFLFSFSFFIIKKHTLQKSPVKSGFFLSHHLRPKKHTNTLFTYKDTIILLKSQSSALLPPNPPNPSPNHHPPRHIRNQIQTKSTLHVYFSFQSRPHLITPPFIPDKPDQSNFSVQTFQSGPHTKTIFKTIFST